MHSALSTLYYPYRMIDKSMAGTDVAVLQAILSARGYYTGPLDGLFGHEGFIDDRSHELGLQVQFAMFSSF